MNYVNDVKFPQLMKLCTVLTGITFLYTFPVWIIIDLYRSFGLLPNAQTFESLRTGLIFFSSAVLSANLIVNHSHWLRLTTAKAYLLLMLYIGAVLVLNHDEVGFHQDVEMSALDYYLPIYLNFIVFFLLGLHLVFLQSMRVVVLLCTVAAASTVLLFVDFSAYRIDVTRYVEGANVGNYQFIGDALAISSLLVVSYYRNALFRTVFILAISVVLFLVGSRTSFILFLFIAVVFYISATRVWWLTISAFIVLALGVFYSGSIDWEELEQSNPRMVQIFIEYEDDNSVIGRKELDSAGWEDIANNPIVGEFGGQRKIDTWGNYMHNFISYWRQFGIFPFLILCALYALFGFFCVLKYPARFKFNYSAPFLIGTFLILESILSRSFAFGYLHLFFGVLLSFHAWCRFGDYFATSRSRRHKRRRRRAVAGAT